ncbi:MAG TPA: hypothetical protein VH934_05390 [Xanthobacteraceae bacterium]
MGLRSICRGRQFLLAALLILPSGGIAAAADTGTGERLVVAQAIPASMAEYHRLLAQYLAARERYEAEAAAYWNAIAEKRRLRAAKRRNGHDILIQDYVLVQPPVYSGPPRPIDPSLPAEEPPPRRHMPVVADFLQAAVREFRFVPRRPQSEIEYKHAYALAAAAAGLTREQAVRIYAFESSGNGKYDVQAGLEYPTPGARAVSTALGYNQLLSTNSVELLAEKGHQFVNSLQAKAAGSPADARTALEHKVAVLKTMVAFSRSVPDSWSAHDRLANTYKGLGVHALNLDLDVGPLLQTQKLLDSVVFARRRGYDRVLTAAELEMMNLTGDGNGFDMIAMPPAWRERVPTANFFQPGGYARNPVAIRNNVVAKLIAATDAKMDQEVRLQGARDLAAAFAR